jgi:hypothetical protein
MHPDLTQRSFKGPPDRLLQGRPESWSSSLATLSSLSHVSTTFVRSFAFKTKPGVYSREVGVLLVLLSLAHSRALVEQNFHANIFPCPLLLSPQNTIYYLDPNTISFTFYDFLCFFPVRPTWFYAFGFVDSSSSFVQTRCQID